MADPKTIKSSSIIHLGELCRWLFLFSAIQSEGFWLKSKYMRAWIVGSMLVAIYMPVIVGIGCNGTVRVSFNSC